MSCARFGRETFVFFVCVCFVGGGGVSLVSVLKISEDDFPYRWFAIAKRGFLNNSTFWPLVGLHSSVRDKLPHENAGMVPSN